MHKFNVFGKIMSVIRQDEQWLLFLESETSIRKRVFDVVIPPELHPSEIKTYLDDMYHEYATETHPSVSEIQ